LYSGRFLYIWSLMDIRVTLLLAAEAAFVLVLLYSSGVLKSSGAVATAALLAAGAFFVRWLMLDYASLDYLDFLEKWVQYFADNGGFRALSGSVGNYNIPYLYFLAWFSYSGINDLYLIKLLSIFFDVVLAWASMQLCGLFVKGAGRKLVCFFIVLYLPTVLLNGAYWGQCDSIYAAFAVMSIYLALDGKPSLAMAAIAAAFAFKLQAVFVMPVFAVMLMSGNVKLRHFLIFPAVYILMVLPAVLLGRPFMETLTLYFSQAGSIGGGLNYNSSSVFSLMPNADKTIWSKLGVVLAFAAMIAVLLTAFIRRRGLNRRAVFAAAVLMAVMIPFLLPHMHDRYFFCADILTLILACITPECAFLPCLVQFGSLLGYYAFLKMQFLLPMRYGGLAMLLAVIAAAVYFLLSFSKNKKRLPY